MASVQNFWVILFVFLSIWQIADDKLPYFWAFLAAFTSANGVVFVPLIGVIIFALKSQKTLLLKWLLFSAILLLVYFVRYSKLPDSQPISLNFSSIVKSGLTLIGSLADFNIYQIFSIRTTLAMSLGLVLIIIIFFGNSFQIPFRIAIIP